jgi:preprotein translocase subunit SecB
MNDAPAATASVALRGQYIKDASFENPRAPASLVSSGEAPKLEVAVNLGAQRLEETVFELAIHINVRAVQEKQSVFLIDLAYGGVLEIKNAAEDQLEPLLFVQGAMLLFPYARRVISDLTRDGGFPPLLLEPIDFSAMYAQQKNRSA